MNPVKRELWKRGNLKWLLHAGQERVYNSLLELSPSIREAVVLISRRWGKSYLGVTMALMDCLQGDDRQVFIIGPDLKQTRRILAPLIKKIAASSPPGLIKQVKSDITWKVGNSTLIVGAFDTALESLRGMEAYSVYLEESALANQDEYHYILSSVIRPTLMHSKGRIVHLTTPPRNENHPFVTDTLRMAETNEALHVYTIEDNPLLSAQDIEDEIAAAGGRESEHCQRELFCRIVKNTNSLIVPEFDVTRHVKPLAVPSHAYFLTAIDFGGVKDNHAIILGYFDFIRNKVCYLDEAWLGINTGTDEIINETEATELRNNVVWLNDGTPNRVVDVPGQTMVDIRKKGFYCYPPRKGKDSIEDGIHALRVAFLHDQIEIDPRCKMLIMTLRYGQWDKQRKDFLRTPSLGHCDMLAALSYSFRHMDRHSNPFPANMNKFRETHYISPAPRDDNEDIISQAFNL